MMERIRARSAVRRAAFLAVATVLALTLVGVPDASALVVNRSITLDPTQNGTVMEGAITVSPTKYKRCKGYVPVRILHRQGGVWVRVGSGQTDGTGFYSIGVPYDRGRYRAVAPRVVKFKNSPNPRICRRAISAVQYVT
jgi:hypothetical protein